MLTFLRKIRRSLVESGSARKYVIYAIGEIALVVFGILIALQISNWNNERQMKQLELATLKELSTALEQDTATIHGSIESMLTSYDKTTALINHIGNKYPHSKALDSLLIGSYTFHTPTFNKFNTASFDLLKERGPDLISNRELRKKIVEHYSKNHAIMTGWFQNVLRAHSLQSDRIFDYFRIDRNLGERTTMTAKDYNLLIEKKDAIDPFYHYKALIVSSIHRYQNFMEETKSLHTLIQNEIRDYAD